MEIETMGQSGISGHVGLSVGIFYLPAAAAMVAAMIVGDRR